MEMSITILNITRYERDEALIGIQSSVLGGAIVARCVASELEQKARGVWRGLPFVCNATSADDAIQQYIERHCEWDYIVPTAVECIVGEVA